MIGHLEILESRRLLTNVVSVAVNGGAVTLRDISKPRAGSGDNFDVSYTSTQLVLTGHNGTVFRVGGNDQATFTATVTSPISLKMFLNSHGNTVNVNGDTSTTPAHLASLDISFGGGKGNNALTLSKVLADSVSVHGAGRGADAVTINNSTIDNDLKVNLSQQVSDVLDLENSTINGNVRDSVGKLIINHSTIGGTLDGNQTARNSTFTSTASTYKDDVTIRMGRDGVVSTRASTDGQNHFLGAQNITGRRRHQVTLTQGAGSVVNDVTPNLRNVSVKKLTASFTAPTVDAITPIATKITGTFDSTKASSLGVTVNGTTYALGTGSGAKLTSPSAGKWALDLTGSPLTAQTTTVTLVSIDNNGSRVTGTGTVTNEQSAISSFLTKNNLTATQTASGLNTVVTTAGTGAIPTAGQTVTVNYTGHILNPDGTLGTEFDSNVDAQFNHVSPFQFKLGAGAVIKGWDEGFALLKVGTVGKLIIPSSLAYGTAGTSGIPANSILVFDITLVSAFKAPTVNSLTTQSDTPTITGTYDSVNAPTLKVAVGGKTYTLGTDAALTTPTAGNWSLNLTGNPLPAGANTVTATSTDTHSVSVTGTGTITNN